MRTIIWFLNFWVSLVLLYPAQWYAIWLSKNGKIEKRDAIVNKCVRGWANRLLKVAGVSISVSGLENIPKGNCIFVSNHQGNFDIPVLLSQLDKAYPIMAKQELKKVPILRTWMCLLQCVFIERDNMRHSMDAINTAIETVNNGYSMVIFPEGTRSRGNKMGEFKQGAFRVAEKTKAILVPIVIDGSYKIMENNKNMIRPAHMTLKILKPIETADFERNELKTLAPLVSQKINAEL